MGPLVVVSVDNISFDGSNGECNIVVDATVGDPLEDVEAAVPSKWRVRFDDVMYEGVAVESVTFNEFKVVFEPFALEAGADVLNYTDSPPGDIHTVAGRALPAVVDRPLP